MFCSSSGVQNRRFSSPQGLPPPTHALSHCTGNRFFGPAQNSDGWTTGAEDFERDELALFAAGTIQHASAGVGMIFTAYNLRRSFNILDKNLLKAYLKVLGFSFSFFQRPFKVIFEHYVGLGVATEFLCTDTRLGLKSNKWDIREEDLFKRGLFTGNLKPRIEQFSIH